MIRRVSDLAHSGPIIFGPVSLLRATEEPVTFAGRNTPPYPQTRPDELTPPGMQPTKERIDLLLSTTDLGRSIVEDRKTEERKKAPPEPLVKPARGQNEATRWVREQRIRAALACTPLGREVLQDHDERAAR